MQASCLKVFVRQMFLDCEERDGEKEEWPCVGGWPCLLCLLMTHIGSVKQSIQLVSKPF